MALPVITGGAKRLGELEKARNRRGGLDLCQGGPGVDTGHRGRDNHPPREEYRGAYHPGGYPCHPARDGLKGPGTPSRKTLLHSPRSARGGSPPLPHSARAESGGPGPGMAISGIPSRARRLEGARTTSSVQVNAPGRNYLSGTHPSSFL